MKPMILFGILLIALGIFALVQKSFTYTTEEKVLDIGPIEATAEKDKTLPLSPLLGAVAVAGGVALVIVGSRKKS